MKHDLFSTMTIFNILYLLCLGGVILSFTNLGISYLSTFLHSNLMHDFRFNFKVNEEEGDNDDEMNDDDLSVPPNSEKINVGGNSSSKNKKPAPNLSDVAQNENLPNVIRSMKEHLKNPEELRNIGNALEETVTTILSNDMLRKAFVEDFRGISVEALHDLLRGKKSSKERSDSSNSDD